MGSTAGPGATAAPGHSAPERDPYSREQLAPVIAEARNWTDLMRRLGLRTSGANAVCSRRK